MTKYQYIILFGCLWGLSEAVLGTFIHLTPLGDLSGYILFPIGFYLMIKTYLKTKELNSILYIGFISAAIKISTLIIYNPAFLLLVLKPAFFIIIESFFGVVIIKIILYFVNQINNHTLRPLLK